MKILITGAAGFLGRNLVRHLDSLHYQLILTDKAHKLFHPTFTESWWLKHERIACDLDVKIEDLTSYIKGIYGVFHTANLARINPSWEKYPDYYHTNITTTQKFFQACQKIEVERFVYISSSSVYGIYQGKQHERLPLKPINPYGVSKMAAESALMVQSQCGDTELLIARPFTMYGDFMDYGVNALVIAHFLHAWKNNQALILQGGGTQQRDFVHASDAVHALRLIMDIGIADEIYNIGSGQSVSIKMLADTISSKQVITSPRLADVPSTWGDITKLSALGFSPQIDVLHWLAAMTKSI